MNRAGRVALALVTAFVLALGSACGATTTTSTASTPSTGAGPQLDPAVAMPKGFPSDFPVYPGSRLTHASQVTANGQTSWGMEWETLNTAAGVQTFYMSKLSQGDWMLPYRSSENGAYSAVFTRRSNSKDTGLLTVEIESNVTHIRLGFGTSS